MESGFQDVLLQVRRIESGLSAESARKIPTLGDGRGCLEGYTDYRNEGVPALLGIRVCAGVAWATERHNHDE